MFFVDLKPAPNNKDIFNVWFIQQCKIKFEPPSHKRNIAQCANCQRYGHTKNYFHLKPRCVKCAGGHLTNQCHRKERSSAVWCVLCCGNHPANYKGWTVYKDLQKKTKQPLRLKQYIPPAQIKQTLHTQLGVTCAQIVERFQSKALRKTVDAPWYVPNTIIWRDLQIPTVKEEIRHYSSQYGARLSTHPNDLIVNLIGLPDTRQLRIHLANDLPTRILV
jgi:hypothetical protein